MPPPKKPKNGPTTVEQFLSREELQKLDEAGSGVKGADGGALGSSSGRNNRSSTVGATSGAVSAAGTQRGTRNGGGGAKTSTSPTTLWPPPQPVSVSITSKSNTTTSPSTSTSTSASAPDPDPGQEGSKHSSLLRELFIKGHTDPTQPDPPGPLHAERSGGSGARAGLGPWSGASKRTSAGKELSSGSDSGRTQREHWTSRPISHTSGISPDASLVSHHAQRGHGTTRTNSAESVRPPNVAIARAYLTSLVKEPPPSSGTLHAPYLDSAALNSGKLLHGLMGASAPHTFIHAAFQLPLMNASTSGHGPVDTSVLAYLASQGAHPHSPLPPLPPLPRRCGPSSLPLVDANATPVTSLPPSLPPSLSAARSVAMLNAASNEPFDLSVKKAGVGTPARGSSVDSDSGSSDKASADLTPIPRPASDGDSVHSGSLSSAPPSAGSSTATTLANNGTCTSPALTNTPRADTDGSPSPGLSRVLSPPHYLMDFRSGSGSVSASHGRPPSHGGLSSQGGKFFFYEASPAATVTAAASLPGQRSIPVTSPQPPPRDNGHSPSSREPSDCKSPCGGEGQGHGRLASSSTPGLGGGGGGPRLGTPGLASHPGMPSQTLMSGAGHLQAPSSTTPEGGVSGMHPNFLSMEPHPSPMGVPADVHIKQEISAGSSTPAKLCQVCNDNASGFHYGVWSCEGCKAFFKRSIQGPVDYMCPATNNCTIDKHRRKSCQACRLRKCYEVGMNKGSQRKERKSSGSNNTTAGKGKRCRADSTDTSDSIASKRFLPSSHGQLSQANRAGLTAKRARCASIVEALQKADLPVLESYHNHNEPPTRVHLLNTLIKLADSELVYLINWAKHVPGYTDLSLSDQVHLIECCWMELLLLNCAFRSMEHEGKRLVFAPDFHLDRQLWNITGMTDILEQVAAVSEQLVQFTLSKEELLLLQATVLVNAEVRRLASYGKIVEMRQMIVDALVVVSQQTHPDNARHVPSLLLLLTHIRQAGERGIAYFQSLKHEGCVTFCDLLTEMLEAHHSPVAANTVSVASGVSVSLPSTSSMGADRKNTSPPSAQMASMGAAVMTKRGNQEDGSINPYV